MTDQKLIAGIFNDFLGLYTGKIQTGIRPLIEKYKSHPMLMGLLSNLDEAAKIQAPKAMKEIYSFYKEYLVNLAKTDSALNAQVLKKHKMLQRCLDYVTQKAYNIALEGAKKKGENGIRANTGLALSGDQVFPWVLEYYAKDDEKEIAEKEQEEKKKIQKEWDSVNKRTKTIPKNQGTKKDSEVHPKEAAEQEEKHISSKKSKDSGQMSLFDMMQPKES